jgi:hypothetical protein
MMELNKYDLVEWVADMICKYHVLCRHCMFKCHNYPECYNRENLINELLKKYNL